MRSTLATVTGTQVRLPCCWVTNATDFLAGSGLIVPADGWDKPLINRSRVVFPEPLAPIRAVEVPYSKRQVTSARALWPLPYRASTPSKVMASDLLASAALTVIIFQGSSRPARPSSDRRDRCTPRRSPYPAARSALGVLGVPAEAQNAEPVEQGDQPSGPVGLMHVQ